MKKRAIFYCLVFFLFLISYVSAVDVSSCQTLNSPNTVYTLTTNLSTGSANCFVISAQNITLNGQGFTISGNNVYPYSGVYLISNSNNSIVKNLKINNFSLGIYSPSSPNQTFINNTIFNSSSIGIYIPSRDNNTIINNTIISANDEGMYLPSTNNNLIMNNRILNSTEEGFFFASSNNNTLINNTINGSGTIGVYMVNANNNIFVNNTITFNYQAGIYLISSSYNNFTSNTISNTTYLSGIVINQSSLYNLIYQNNINRNNYNGIHLIDSTNHTNISENTLFYNLGYGISLEITAINKQNYFNVITGNIINSSQYDGVACYYSPNSTIYNNTVINSKTIGLNFLGGCDYSTVYNNTFSNSGNSGVNLISSSYNNFTNNFFNKNNESSVALTESNYNLFNQERINDSNKSAFNVEDSNFNIFKRLEISFTNISYYDFQLQNSNSSSFIDIFSIGNYSFSNSEKNIFENTLYGKLELIPTINGTGYNFSKDIYFLDNLVYVNESNSLFNKPLNISIYGTPGNEKINLAVYKNNVICSDCYVFNSLTDSIVLFNTSSGGSYHIGGDSIPQTTPIRNIGGRALKTYLINETNILEGYYAEIYTYDKIIFQIGKKNHTLTLNWLNSTLAKITLESKLIKVNLTLKQEEIIDLNNDGKGDLIITYEEFNRNKAKIFLKEIIPEYEKITSNNQKSGYNSTKLSIIIASILIIVLSIIIFKIISNRRF